MDTNGPKRFHIRVIKCETCNNEFFVRHASLEFVPKFCCYCGVRFISVTLKDASDDKEAG